MQYKRIERKALTVGIVVNIIMVIAGAIVFFMTGLKSMFLDTFFTVISVVSGFVATFLSSRTVRTTDRFPNGMFALEPIYAICKAIFTLSLLVFSFVDVARVAYDYFVYGIGERMTVGPVVVYEIITVVMCFMLLMYYRHENSKINGSSTMLQAESQSTLVDGLISLGIGAAAVILWFLPEGTPLDFLHYTGDFFITTAIVIMAIKEPFQVLHDSFIELVGGVYKDDGTNAFVEEIAQQHLPADTEYQQTMIFKTGMNFEVDVYLTGTGETVRIADVEKCKREMESALKKRLQIVDVDFVFE